MKDAAMPDVPCPDGGDHPPDAAAFAALVAWLREPASYVAADGGLAPESAVPRQVEFIETHLSCVFLTERFAYKLPKPVRFDFVDFRSSAARRRDCFREIELNRRQAPGVYLEVLAVARDAAGKLCWQNPSSPPAADADRSPESAPLVKMRRLPAQGMLDRRLAEESLTSEDVARLAATLADFYSAAAPLPIDAEQYRRDILHHVRDNLAELSRPAHQLPADLVRRTHTRQLALLELRPALFYDRVTQGRVIDGHGDLRPEHVCFDGSQVLVFDCVEFSDEFRRIDVLDELAFLGMECQLVGRDDVAEAVAQEYLQRSGDRADLRLLAFYSAYRACVRAKVAALRAEQAQAAEGRASAMDAAARYLQLADQFSSQLPGPLLAVMRGTMGSGKSTVARELAQRLALVRLSTDDLRDELFPRLGDVPAGSATDDYLQGRYAPEARRQVYEALLQRADALLADGQSVVLDGAFLGAAELNSAWELAGRCGVRPLLLECVCPSDVAFARIAKRRAGGGDSSEARPELLERQQRDAAPVPETWPQIKLDAAARVEEQLAAALDAWASGEK